MGKMWENGGLTEKTWNHHGRLVILTREPIQDLMRFIVDLMYEW